MTSVSGKGTPWMPLIEVWAKRYAATGESGKAFLLWRGPAKNFDEAVKRFNLEQGDKLKAEHYPEREKSKWYYWGCALFDNEADVRKSFE